MGTRSTTAILDEDGNQLVKLYRQFDGYLTGHGQELADFLKVRSVVNGYGMEMTSADTANGMGCLAAQLIGHLKGDQLGNVYITNGKDSQEYNYTVYLQNGLLYLKAESQYAGLLYDALASDFNGEAIENALNEADEDEGED